MKRRLLLTIVPFMAACAASAPPAPAPADPASAGTVAADVPRDSSPNVAPAELEELEAGNAAFAIELYRALAVDPSRAGANLFVSPFAISEGLAMTYAGAGGATATEMAGALHFTLPSDRLHPAFDALDLLIASRAKGPAVAGTPFTLVTASSLWGEQSVTFLAPFLRILAVDYGAGMRVTGFAADPEGARAAINGFVDRATNDLVPTLVPTGGVDRATKLVLASAVSFDAAWSAPFDPAATAAGTFHGSAGDVPARMMTSLSTLPYGEGAGYEAVALGYQGGLSLVAVLPHDLASFESSLSLATLLALDASLAPRDAVSLAFPAVSLQATSLSLGGALRTLGMRSAFDPAAASFSGMSSTHVWIQDVVHEAVLRVDESGSGAAGVVGSGGAPKPAPSVSIAFDRPFAFYIRDDVTKSIVFVGRVETL